MGTQHLAVVGAHAEAPRTEPTADRIRRLQDEAAAAANKLIVDCLGALEDMAADLLSVCGDDIVSVSAGKRDALKKLAMEIDSRITSIRQITARG